MTFAPRNLAWLGLTAGCAMAAPAVARAPAIVPAHPLGNPGDWVTPNDYPARALRNGENGTVGFALSYDAQGKVTACEVTASSGSADLDEVTCQSLMARAGFKPGTKGGKPEGGVYRSSVRWQIPEDADDVPVPGSISLSYTINADGHVSDCVGIDEKGVQNPIPAGSGPPACASGALLKPAKDASGKPVSKRVTLIFTTKVDDVP
ncbi:energy transducer TonB [Novosphingobium sp. SG720]|uniref:energy transducer TonB n=1 Tax=Novosphingobium sp. SG720 TaxID=2586998 RepID=UPI001445729B|nr:energy transducer TonB [Novosphingobium sp. SG720]NKJ41677.1 TonB family protein [Novosphingobium sp. SG720]